MKFLKEDKVIIVIQDYDGLFKFNPDQITVHLEDFVIELNAKIKPSGIMSTVTVPELFFEMNRKICYKKLVRKSINKDDVEKDEGCIHWHQN